MRKLAGVLQAKVYAFERCAKFNFYKKHKRRNRAILFDSQIATRVLDSYAVESNIAWNWLKKLNQQVHDLCEEWNCHVVNEARTLLRSGNGCLEREDKERQGLFPVEKLQ